MKYLHLLSFSMFVVSMASVGCDKPVPPAPAAPPAGTSSIGAAGGGHAHGTGPNGGVVFDLGKYHAEFTVDHPKSECTVLIVTGDSADATPVPIAAKELTLTTKETKTADGQVVPPMTVTLLPVDVSEGKAAKFVGTNPGISNVADFAGTVLGEIDGKPSQGDFQE
jgi:hypothetical protein